MLARLVTSQAIHRWPITLLLCIALTTVVSLHVYLRNSAAFTNRSMQLIMKNMGHNLLILPAHADVLAFHSCSDQQTSFDESVCTEMARHRRLASKYYANILQQRIRVGDGDAVLTGMAPVQRGDETPEKPHLYEDIPADAAFLGAAIARDLELKEGDAVSVLGRGFTVRRVQPAEGTIDDYRVWIDLGVCQDLLERQGDVNAILAFLCMHGKSLRGVLDAQQNAFDQLFPEFRVVPRMSILEGRYLARMTTNRYLEYLLLLVLGITVLVIVVTGLQEVAERRHEIGILLAMGAGYTYIILLYVAKILAVAWIASLAGFLIGSCLSRGLLAPLLVANTNPVAIVWAQLPYTMALTCLVALAAEIVPLAKLVRMDPNVVLTEE
jgi:predicted lysophospholipase L1 biosynthesis ABC-type transport system permease subunit